MNPPEHTIEEENGLDFGLARNFGYGEFDEGEFRVASSHSAPVETDAARTADYDREPTSFTGVSRSDVARVLALDRSPTSFSNLVETDAGRIATYNRSTTAFSSSVQTDAQEALHLARTSTGYTASVFSDAVSKFVYGRTADTYTQPVQTDSGRVADYTRNPTSYTGSVVSDSLATAAYWIVGGLQLRDLIEETRLWDELVLVFRLGKTDVEDRVRPLEADSGSVEVIIDSEGTFRAVDRAGGKNTYGAVAPRGRHGVRFHEDYLVGEITEEVVDQQGEQYEVEIVLIPDEAKGPQDNYGDEARATDEWKFEMDTGNFTTKRVNREIQQGADSTERSALSLVTDERQTRVIEESLRKLGTVSVREIPDGDDLAEDNSPDTVNTATVTPPDGKSDVFSAGNYVVEDWETEWINDVSYEVTLELRKT